MSDKQPQPSLFENLLADWEEECQGMPEFDQADKTSFKAIIIHFKDQAAVDQFSALIGQKITPLTRSTWFPEIEIETYADKAYVDEKQQQPTQQ